MLALATGGRLSAEDTFVGSQKQKIHFAMTDFSCEMETPIVLLPESRMANRHFVADQCIDP